MSFDLLVGSILTLVGILGAAIGVLAAERAARIEQLMPFSAGLLLGIAVFLIFPEAMVSGRWPAIIGCSVTGCIVFGVAEHYLGHAHSEHKGAVAFSNWSAWAPLLVALSLHDALDGWNIGLACNLADPKLVWTFLAGMGLHKFTGGVASGAIFRTSIRSTGRSLLAAGAAEALTLAGVMLEMSLRTILGGRWTAWFLAATGGSFLYLAFHAIQQARRRENANLTFRYAILGFASVGLVSLLSRG